MRVMTQAILELPLPFRADCFVLRFVARGVLASGCDVEERLLALAARSGRSDYLSLVSL
jgi:hypothetical protein